MNGLLTIQVETVLVCKYTHRLHSSLPCQTDYCNFVVVQKQVIRVNTRPDETDDNLSSALACDVVDDSHRLVQLCRT